MTCSEFDDRLYFTGLEFGSIKVWDNRNLRTCLVDRKIHSAKVRKIATSQSRKNIVVSCSEDKSMIVCHLNTKEDFMIPDSLDVSLESINTFNGHSDFVTDFLWMESNDHEDNIWTVSYDKSYRKNSILLHDRCL